MNLSLTFGDVFIYQNNEYVFLTECKTGTYVAKVLDSDLTKQLKHRKLRAAKKETAKSIDSRRIFLYVLLDTSEYKGRACYHGYDAQKNMLELHFDKSNVSLSKSDLVKLKEDIMNRPVNEELRALVTKISI